MIKELTGPATIFIDGKEIECTIERMEVDIENPYEDIDFSNEPIELSYEGTVTLTAGTIETPKEDPRIGSRVLHKHFKSITLGKRLYSRISRSLDKLGVKK